MTSVLLREAHQCGEPTIWITAANSVFFPPDMEAAGVELAALPVVWAESATNAAEAAELLLRSNGFGLIVIDFGETKQLKDAVLGRLVRIAGHFHTAVLCITHKPQRHPSLGSMIAMRLHAMRRQDSSGNYRCGINVLKDKRNGPTGSYWEERYAPAGLR
jgi:recombination protein RecA